MNDVTALLALVRRTDDGTRLVPFVAGRVPAERVLVLDCFRAHEVHVAHVIIMSIAHEAPHLVKVELPVDENKHARLLVYPFLLYQAKWRWTTVNARVLNHFFSNVPDTLYVLATFAQPVSKKLPND